MYEEVNEKRYEETAAFGALYSLTTPLGILNRLAVDLASSQQS